MPLLLELPARRARCRVAKTVGFFSPKKRLDFSPKNRIWIFLPRTLSGCGDGAERDRLFKLGNSLDSEGLSNPETSWFQGGSASRPTASPVRTLRSPRRGLRAASRAGPGLPAPRFVENPASEMLISARFWNPTGANGTACSGLSRSPARRAGKRPLRGARRRERRSRRGMVRTGQRDPEAGGRISRPAGEVTAETRCWLPFGVISPDVRNFPGQGAASGAGFWIPYPPGPAWVMGRRFKGRLCSGHRGVGVISAARLASPSSSPRSLSPAVRSRGPGRLLSLLKRPQLQPWSLPTPSSHLQLPGSWESLLLVPSQCLEVAHQERPEENWIGWGSVASSREKAKPAPFKSPAVLV